MDEIVKNLLHDEVVEKDIVSKSDVQDIIKSISDYSKSGKEFKIIIDPVIEENKS